MTLEESRCGTAALVVVRRGDSRRGLARAILKGKRRVAILSPVALLGKPRSLWARARARFIAPTEDRIPRAWSAGMRSDLFFFHRLDPVLGSPTTSPLSFGRSRRGAARAWWGGAVSSASRSSTSASIVSFSSLFLLPCFGLDPAFPLAPFLSSEEVFGRRSSPRPNPLWWAWLAFRSHPIRPSVLHEHDPPTCWIHRFLLAVPVPDPRKGGTDGSIPRVDPLGIIPFLAGVVRLLGNELVVGLGLVRFLRRTPRVLFLSCLTLDVGERPWEGTERSFDSHVFVVGGGSCVVGLERGCLDGTTSMGARVGKGGGGERIDSCSIAFPPFSIGRMVDKQGSTHDRRKVEGSRKDTIRSFSSLPPSGPPPLPHERPKGKGIEWEGRKG